MRKRLRAALLCLCLLFTLLPATAFAEGEPDSGPQPAAQSALCEHHPSHDESCGYSEGTAGSPCAHEHTEDCYILVTECVHEHGPECYPEESVSENTATPSEAAKVEPAACTHVCSEESGCITEVLACKHEHDEACGYVPAAEGTPCAFVCEICGAEDGAGDSKEDIEALVATPSNALAAPAPLAVTAYDTLWIGNTLITGSGYWTTDTNGNLTASDADNYNIAFNAASNTLTLNNATIVGLYDANNNPGMAGIYAYSSSGDVSLTIQVTGNNMVSGDVGICALSNGGEVSVAISGGGSLNTSGGGSGGIRVVSIASNAALTIENADVTAEGGAYAVGVLVLADSNSSASLAVEGGSLTASGSTGILYGSSGSDPAPNTVNLTVSDSALVDARGGGIQAGGGDSAKDVTPTADSSGIVFDGDEGTVYGNVTLQGNLEIGEDESLKLAENASLSANGHNVIVDGGTLDESLAESLGNSVIYKVTKVELDKSSLTLDEDSTATLTATITPSNATDQNVVWSSDPSGIVTIAPSTDTKTATITATGTGGTSAIITATVDGKSAQCTVTVNAAQVQTYTVTLETNGGTINNGDITSYTQGVGAALPTDVARSGYKFAGWYDNEAMTGSPVAEITATDTGNKTYYAKWLSTDAGVASVSVNGVTGNISGDQITVTLPPNSALPDGTDDISITAAAGATCSTPTMSADTASVTYTFTVTAEDGTTTEDYTVTVTVAADPAAGNKADVDAAKTTIERHTWTVPQATANTEEAVKAWIEEQLAGMSLNGAGYTVTMTGFTAADRGTSADRDGTNGSFAFTVVLLKGTATGNASTSTCAEATAAVTGGTITAAAYRGSGNSSGGGSYTGPVSIYYADGRTIEIPSDATQGTWEQETASDKTISWRFKLTDGSYAVNRWIKALYNGQYLWYRMDANGYLLGGWFTDTDGNIYYLHPYHDGAFGYMYIGDHAIDGAPYSFSMGREQDGLPEGALIR